MRNFSRKDVFLCGLVMLLAISLPVSADYHSGTREEVPQSAKLDGVVKNTEGEPVIGAAVVIKGTTVGVATDAEGRFSIQARPGSVLVITCIGYKSLVYKVGEDRRVEIVLKEEITELGEAVVTAMGIRKTNRNIGYAVSTVKGDVIAGTNTINPITALQGRVAGLDINIIGASGIQSSPGIVIRGAKSLSKSAQPIFVIDGIVMENNESPVQGSDWGSQLKNLNPDDYAEITVLKGAAATALYGSRGANGAVVITSKSGEGMRGIGVEVSYTYQWENIYANHIELQDVFGAGYPFSGREGDFGDDGNPMRYGYGFSFGPKMEGQMVTTLYNPKDIKVPYSPKKDNWKTFYQDGSYQNTNVAISGGNDKGNFRLSFSNTKNVGVLPNNDLLRNSLSLRGNTELNELFSIDFGFSYTRTKVRNAAAQGRWNDASNYGRTTTYVLPRDFDLEFFSDNYRREDGTIISWGALAPITHLLDRRDSRNDVRREESILGNLQLNMKFTDWLDASVKVNYNLYKIFNETKVRGSGVNYAGGYYGIGGEERSSYNGLAMIHGFGKFLDDDLTLDVRLMSEMYGNNRSQGWSKNTEGGLIVPQIYAISNSVGEVRPRYWYTPANQRTVGVAGIVNLNWKDQVNLEITGRNDWLSTLMYPGNVVGGKNNNTVFYPSVNLSWIFTDTFRDFIPENLLTFGKLRGSVAYVGMGTTPYATSLGGYNHKNIFDADGNSITVAQVNNAGILPNYDLKPEKQRTIEFGADLRFFGDRAGIDFAWYRQNTKNQILNLSGVPEAGFSRRAINAGDIQNTGLEVQLDFTPVLTTDWRWDVNMNFTRNRGKVKELHPEVKEYEMMGNYEGVSVFAYEGGEFGVMTGTNVRATDPETGKFILGAPFVRGGVLVFDYKHERHLGRYNEDYKRTPLGNVQPDWLCGLSTTLTYKNLQLYVGMNARIGGVLYSNSYNLGMQNGTLKESLPGRMGDGAARTNYKGETVYDGFIPDGIFADGESYNGTDLSGMTYQQAVDQGLFEPVSSAANYNWNYSWSWNVDQAVFDNTWLKLREISLTYNFNRDLLKKIRLQGLQLTFTAHNVGYLYNNLKGKLNPESVQSNNPFNPVEFGGVPYSRSFSFGLRAKF